MRRTIDGIQVELDPRKLTDARTVSRMVRVFAPIPEGLGESEERAAIAERVPDILDFAQFILGDQFDSVYEGLGRDTGGYVDLQTLMGFVSRVFEEFSAKN